MRNRLLYLFVLLLVSAVLYSCKEDKQINTPNNVVLSFNSTIIDNNNNQVANAIFEIYSLDNSQLIASDTSDENGNISFEEIEVANFNLEFKINHPLFKDKQLKYDESDKSNNKVSLEDKEECCGKAKFKVTDEEGNILKNVEVKVRLNSKLLLKATTDDEGYVFFEGLCLDEYNIRLALEGYKVIEKDIQIDNCDNVLELDFKMIKNDETECCDAILKFIVQDKDSKDALSNAKITLKLNGKVIFEKKATDNEGEYLAKELCKGKYTVIIEREGYKRIETSWNIEKCETKQEHFWLEKENKCCGGSIRLVVKDENGNVLRNKTVRLWKGSTKLKEVKTNDNGVVEMGELCEGNDYSISIISEEHENIEFNFELGCNKKLDFEKKLNTLKECCDAILKFIVLDKDSKDALSNAKITLKLNGKVIFEKKATDNEGEYLAKELCKGKYTVIIEREGYKRIETSWNIEKCETKQEHFWLEKESDCCGSFVRVIVKDENGNKLQNKTVRLWKGSTKLKEVKTDANGVVEFEKLCEGNDYSLSIISEEHENIEFKFEVGCNKELNFEKKLNTLKECCDAILKFIVMDKDTKTALSDAKITLKLNGKVIFEKKSTDSEGEYLAKELCKGKYTVIIEKDGYNRIETSWNVERCETKQEHFWMTK